MYFLENKEHMEHIALRENQNIDVNIQHTKSNRPVCRSHCGRLPQVTSSPITICTCTPWSNRVKLPVVFTVSHGRGGGA